MIDLSSIEPENLGPLHLEQIPLCSFAERGRPYKPYKPKPKKKKSRRSEEERRGRKKGSEGQGGERKGKKSSEEHAQVRAAAHVCVCMSISLVFVPVHIS